MSSCQGKEGFLSDREYQLANYHFDLLIWKVEVYLHYLHISCQTKKFSKRKVRIERDMCSVKILKGLLETFLPIAGFQLFLEKSSHSLLKTPNLPASFSYMMCFFPILLNLFLALLHSIPNLQIVGSAFYSTSNIGLDS